jgi:hypothetical protein
LPLENLNNNGSKVELTDIVKPKADDILNVSRSNSNESVACDNIQMNNITNIANYSEIDDLLLKENILRDLLLITLNSSEILKKSKMTSTSKSLLFCFDALKFPEFQAKMKTKLSHQGGYSHDTADSGISKVLGQDVFRILLQKITSLEQNFKIMELFVTQV